MRSILELFWGIIVKVRILSFATIMWTQKQAVVATLVSEIDFSFYLTINFHTIISITLINEIATTTRYIHFFIIYHYS